MVDEDVVSILLQFDSHDLAVAEATAVGAGVEAASLAEAA